MEMTTFDEMPLTLGDLCAAIANRRLPYSVANGEYILRRSDVRDLQRAESTLACIVRDESERADTRYSA